MDEHQKKLQNIDEKMEILRSVFVENGGNLLEVVGYDGFSDYEESD